MNTTEFTNIYYKDRRSTLSRKWDGEHLNFSRTDLLPLWVADMDFQSPHCIGKAIANYATSNILGYTMENPRYKDAIIHWHKRRHNNTINPEWICTAPNVITSIMWCLQAFTKENDSILIINPVYGAFSRAINGYNRRIVNVPLTRNEDNSYTLDMEQFEQVIIQKNVKLYIHCNPHNPIGHVWTRNEMETMFAICARHDVLILSDEIHQDLAIPNRTIIDTADNLNTDATNDFNAEPIYPSTTSFTPALTIDNGAYNDRIIATSAVTKTFNLASIHQTEVFIPCESLRRRFTEFKSAVYHTDADVLAETAIIAAYTSEESLQWLEGLYNTVRQNYEYVCNELRTALPLLRISPMNGTYMMWIDFSAYIEADNMHDVFENKLRLAPSFGEWFGGPPYTQFVRINLATSLENIKEAVQRIINHL